MKTLLLEIEKFLRWFGRLSPEQRAEQAGEISEACQVFADDLEQVIDTLPEDIERSEDADNI